MITFYPLLPSIIFCMLLCSCNSSNIAKPTSSLPKTNNPSPFKAKKDKPLETNYPSWEHLPKDLLFDGKPLDAMLMANLDMGDSSRFEPCNLTETRKRPSTIKILPTSEWCSSMHKQGFFGYETKNLKIENELKNLGIENDSMSEAYGFWKYLGTISGTHKHIIQTEKCGGGSGRFSSIILVERDGNFIKNAGELFRGDRECGGIVKVSFNDSVLSVWQYATPYEIFSECLEALIGDKNKKVSIIKDGYEDKIEFRNQKIPYHLSCAALNGVGEVLTTWKEGTYEIISIELETESMGSHSPLEKSFNYVIEKYMSQGCNKLDRPKMKQFAEDVLEYCISNFKVADNQERSSSQEVLEEHSKS